MLTTLSRSLFGWRHNLQPSGDIDVNTGRGGLYATYFDKGFYVNAAAYGGYNDTPRAEARMDQAIGFPLRADSVANSQASRCSFAASLVSAERRLRPQRFVHNYVCTGSVGRNRRRTCASGELLFIYIRRGGATTRRVLTGASRPASPPIPPDGRERSNRAA